VIEHRIDLRPHDRLGNRDQSTDPRRRRVTHLTDAVVQAKADTLAPTTD
jgi:hypothetical protein